MKIFLIDDDSGHWFDEVAAIFRERGYDVYTIAKKDASPAPRAFGDAAFDAIVAALGGDKFCVVTDATFARDSNGASGGSNLLHRLKDECEGFQYGVVYSENPECERIRDRIEALDQDATLHYARSQLMIRFFESGCFRPLSGLFEMVQRLAAVLKFFPFEGNLDSRTPWIAWVQEYGRPTPEAESARLGGLFQGLGHGVHVPFAIETEDFFSDDVYTAFIECFPPDDARGRLVRDILGRRHSLDIAAQEERSPLLDGTVPGALRILWDLVMCGGDLTAFRRDFVPSFLAPLNSGQKERYASVLPRYEAVLAKQALSPHDDAGWHRLYKEVLRQWALLETAVALAKGNGVFE